MLLVTVQSVSSWLHSKNKQMDFLPPQSPDLNSIEHVWDILGATVEGKKLKSLKELEEKLKETCQLLKLKI